MTTRCLKKLKFSNHWYQGNLILDPDYEDLKNAVESSRLGRGKK